MPPTVDRHHPHYNHHNHRPQEHDSSEGDDDVVIAVAVEPVIDSKFRSKLIEFGMTPNQANEMGSQGVSNADILSHLDEIAMDELFHNTPALKGLSVMTKYKIRALQSWLKEQDNSEAAEDQDDDDDSNTSISLSEFTDEVCQRQMKKMSQQQKKKKKSSRHLEQQQEEKIKQHDMIPSNDKMSRGDDDHYDEPKVPKQNFYDNKNMTPLQNTSTMCGRNDDCCFCCLGCCYHCCCGGFNS